MNIIYLILYPYEKVLINVNKNFRKVVSWGHYLFLVLCESSKHYNCILHLKRYLYDGFSRPSAYQRHTSRVTLTRLSLDVSQ